MELVTFEKFFQQTDFILLKEQKTALIEAQSALHAIGGEHTKTADTLEGLINFLDAFQDMAVDTYGKDKYEVFHLHDDNENLIYSEAEMRFAAKEILKAWKNKGQRNKLKKAANIMFAEQLADFDKIFAEEDKKEKDLLGNHL